MSKRPTKAEFLAYAKSREIDKELAGDQWEAWEAGDWRDGKGFAIVSWKQKLITYEKMGYGMFGKRHQRRISADDEVERKRRAAEDTERRNREYERKQRKE